MVALLITGLTALSLGCASATREPFIPSAHGFSFRNSFEGDPIPEFLRNSPFGGLIKRGADAGVIKVPNRFGLCGGMSAAATDFWLAGKPIPAMRVPPKPGEPLYDYLKRRQTESLGGGGVMAVKFIEWMMMNERDDGACTQNLTAFELATISDRVKSEGFAQVGLVYVDRKGLPWENHQVLAFNVKEHAGSWWISIYDPNFPNRDDVVLHVVVERGPDGRNYASTAQIWRGGTRHVRGLFAMPYRKSIPPQ